MVGAHTTPARWRARVAERDRSRKEWQVQDQPPAQYGGMPPQSLQPQEDNDKIMAALCYILPILMSVIILVTDMKNKPFLKYHAYQSLVLGVALWVVYIVLGITVFGLCLLPIPFVLQIYYAYLAYSKGIFTIPLVTNLTAQFFKDFPSPTGGTTI
jgi:uncharacterized membrane protein